MYASFRFFLLLVLAFGTPNRIPSIPQMVEICDNAIDDDNDGLVDLNDADCKCAKAEATSLIPNPSFEDRTCCPANRSQMDCAVTWIQASAPTTDYIHTCGWTGWENLPMPLPIPDGEGAVGFRDGRFTDGTGTNGGTTTGSGNNGDVATNNNGTSSNTNSDGSDRPNWKEYAGACLTSPLRAGISYKFQFYIGFTDLSNSPPLDITFFGTESCDNLPFGNGDSTFGCPTNGPDWSRLGAVRAAGANEWRQLEINVTPTTDIYAISIGPPCIPSSSTVNPYYFFDNLVLAEQSAFEFDIQVNNQLCANNLSFELPEYDTLTYQWYKDGVALVGETNARLDLPPGEGNYVAVFTSSETCKATRPFRYFIPTTTTSLVKNICEGQSYDFDNQTITSSGVYWDTLKTRNNCDSIIRLELSVGNNMEETVSAKLFPGEAFAIGDFKYNQPGTFSQTIPSSIGCDSMVNLTLEYYAIYTPNIFSPNGDGINDYFTINGDADLVAINAFKVFDRWGNQVYNQPSLPVNNLNAGWDGNYAGNETSSGVYLYTALLLMEDGIERQVSGMVTLIR